ncbi:DUF1214 domain-containing protein [Flavobacterium sp.]|uniref:DUF1214 domain-containing protein n=1 Tax=Flavobacterium sp. TaxID=239 RepID=UPI00374D487D
MARSWQIAFEVDIPAKQFWSVVLYDNQTRPMLQTDQQFRSVSSQKKETQVNADGSVDLYLGPKSPAGKESNWVQTLHDKGWSIILRFYGPQKSWFDKTWKPSETEEMQ